VPTAYVGSWHNPQAYIRRTTRCYRKFIRPKIDWFNWLACYEKLFVSPHIWHRSIHWINYNDWATIQHDSSSSEI